MNNWKTQSSQIILENAWFKIRKDQVTTPTNKPGEYTYMENQLFVLIVGISEKGWVMISQYRYPIKQKVIEFPAGSIEASETPSMAAKREFKEETGYVVAQWTELGVMLEAISTNCARGTLFLAEGLTHTREHKQLEDGIDGVLLVSSDEIEGKILSGEIADAKTIAAYFRAKKYLEKRLLS